jgi:hypothetical protein
MRVGLLLCLAGGHRWAPADDVHETYAVLRCARCGRETTKTAETHGPIPYSAKRASPQSRMSGSAGRDGRPF